MVLFSDNFESIVMYRLRLRNLEAVEFVVNSLLRVKGLFNALYDKLSDLDMWALEVLDIGL